jgi:serine/threonine protein kinase
LFGEALAADDPSAPADGSEPARPPRFRQLRSRADFYEKYELLKKIGGGGQGDIWQVRDHEFRREVAMKRLAGRAFPLEHAAYRFLAEAQITSQLYHPGILPVFDVGLDPDGKLFYTTQLLPGTTFRDVWRQVQNSRDSEKSLNRALELLLRVCEVLAHAHSRGVIHRDLKPDNILVGAFGEVRVIDWGSAKILAARRAEFEEPFVSLQEAPLETDLSDALTAPAGSPHATANSKLPFTPVFAAPELLRGELEHLGPPTDIYSLGVMLYELLAGRMPYSDKDGKLPVVPILQELILAGPPPRLRCLKPAVSRDLAAICEQAMAHDWRNRTRSAIELAEDIRAVLEVRPVRARHPGPLLILQKWAQRNYSQVLLGSLGLVLVSAALSFAHAFKAERDSARQIQAVRNAELAARNGRWREAITNWQAAAAAGYSDQNYLDLQLAEAWTVLTEPDRSGALLTRLAARSDLGSQRGAVLLRLGEHQLFDRATAAHGLQLVRDAQAAGLNNADQCFARGLLADSTPAALDLFHQALQYDPYHHEAHVHSVSLEWLLGRHQELATHLAIFKILYPEDPSPVFIAAAEAAMAGDLPAAQAGLAGLRNVVATNILANASHQCQAYAQAASFYELDALLQASPSVRTPLDQLRNDPFSFGSLLMPGDFTGLTNRTGKLRLPWLPCIQQGIMTSSDGLKLLLLPYMANPSVAASEIASGWRHHPEAMMPTLGGMLLENLQPKTGPPRTAVLEMQASLYQMGADSPSMMPVLERLARYLAVCAESQLAGLATTNSVADRAQCLANLRSVVASPETSTAECQAYFQIALHLGASDLAWQLVSRLENTAPDSPAVRRCKIQAELALGAFGPALAGINQLLDARPGDPWALAQRQSAQAGLKTIWDANQMRFPANPTNSTPKNQP